MIPSELLTFDVATESARIASFIQKQVGKDHPVLLGVSGGLDSDVVARLTAAALGSKRMRCFTVLQQDFEEKYLDNVRRLTADLDCDLIQISMQEMPRQIVKALAIADPEIGFRPDGLLDVGRMKCACRTLIFSAYSERGFLIAGPSNRTEYELGYYLPFGDGLSHFSPIAHLYKTQVRALAKSIGVHAEVLDQPPAAGFWKGDSDLEGLAFWLFNEAPIPVEGDWTDAQLSAIQEIQNALSFEGIDSTLLLLNRQILAADISRQTKVPLDIVQRLAHLRERAQRVKNRTLGARLEPTW